MAKYRPEPNLREMQWKLPDGPFYARTSKTVVDPAAAGGARRVWLEESTGLRNKVEARKRVMEILATWEKTSTVKQRIELFREASAAYAETRKNKSPATQASINFSRKHLDAYFGTQSVERITLNTWESFVAHRRSEAPDCALYNDWKNFSGVMNLMHAQGHRTLKLTVPNPDADRELSDETLEDGEIERLFRAANPTTQLQMALSHDLFLRPPKEVCSLKYSDFNFEVKEFTSRGRTQVSYGYITIVREKRKGGTRYVPLTRVLRETILEYKAMRDKRCLRDYGRTSPFLFYSRGNPDLPAANFATAFENSRQRAGIKPCTPYILRHSGLTTAYRNAKAEAGMDGTKEIPPDAIKIALVAGHSIDTAMKRYLHLKPEDLIGVLGLGGGLGGSYLGTTKIGACGRVEKVD